jgi:hypothetical protein
MNACDICVNLRNIIETAKSQGDARKVMVFCRLLDTHEKDIHGGQVASLYQELPGSELLFGKPVKLGR